MADNKAIVAKLLDALWNKGQLSVADELVSKDFVGYWPFRAEPVKGPVGYKGLVAELWKVFPDQKMRILDQIAAGASTEASIYEVLHINYDEVIQGTAAYLRKTYL